MQRKQIGFSFQRVSGWCELIRNTMMFRLEAVGDEPDGSGKFTEGDVPADMASAVSAAREALVEAAGSEAPLVVLGSPEDLDPARALARELRNAPCLAWQPGDAAFFRRLVQWRLRRALQERQATP